MSQIVIDAIDRKILKYLITNARMPFLEIARKCGISGAAIHQRIKKLDESGVILGSRLVVDPKMLGFDVCAYIGIRLQDVSILMQTVDRLKQIPEIVECHFITGTYNLFVKLYCVDNEHLMTTLCDRILAIPGISTTQTYISLNEAFHRPIYVDCLHDCPQRDGRKFGADVSASVRCESTIRRAEMKRHSGPLREKG